MKTEGSKKLRVRVQKEQFTQEQLLQMKMEGKQLIRVRRRKPNSKRRYLLLGVLLLLILASSISLIVGYVKYEGLYRADLSLTQSGTQHLQKAETLLLTWLKRPLDTQLTNQAQGEFTSALETFRQLDGDLQSFPAIFGQIPTYGTRLTSALRLVPLAINLSQAGITGCSILNTLLAGMRDPLTPQGHGITASDLSLIAKDIKDLKSELFLAVSQVNQLQPADMQFDSRISKIVGIVRKDVPLIQGWLNTSEQLLPVVPLLIGIGAPANYLIEVLDPTELRPGGGFIGNYGIATLSGGRLMSARITDVDLLDKPFEFAGHVIPYPSAYKWFDLAQNSWSLRDSNLDADFPTSARNGEQIYTQEGGKVPVQGVIAITPAFIQRVLAITGPINMLPEYNETVTSQNLIDRIHYYQLGPGRGGSDLIPSPDGHSSLRKRFTELLSEHLLARVRQLPSSALSKLLLQLVDQVSSKDVQIYFNSSLAENVLHSFHLDAAIQSPPGDSLFVVDANIAVNKANNFIVNMLDDQVTIDSQGNAMHRTTLRYAWTQAGQIYGNPLYRDFVHVYVPSGSLLLMQVGWQPHGESSAFNREVWMGYFELSYGQTRTITLEWKVPAVANKVQADWHYQYLIQRQAGTLWKLNLHITLPPCAALNSKWLGLTSNYEQRAELVQSLTQDLNVGVSYRCE